MIKPNGLKLDGMIYLTQHMIEEHGMNQHKLERMNWLVRVDPRTKGSEEQVEAVEEMEKLVDQITATKHENQRIHLYCFRQQSSSSIV